MVLVSFLLIAAAFGFASRQVFVSEARESMMTNSREISRMAVAYAAEGDLRSLELRMTLSTIGASTNQHIFIINPSGYIITCSDSAVFCEHIGKRLDESVTAILPQSGTVASLGTLGGFTRANTIPSYPRSPMTAHCSAICSFPRTRVPRSPSGRRSCRCSSLSVSSYSVSHSFSATRAPSTSPSPCATWRMRRGASAAAS